MNFKVRFRRFIARYLVFFVELVYAFKFKFLKFDKPPIIILTPGKVGSSSIYATLKETTSFPVFHIHNLSEEGIARSVQTHLSSDRRSKPLHLIVSDLLRKKLKDYKGRRFVICVIREPISREISSFFQNIDFYKNDLENHKLEVDLEKTHKRLKQKFQSNICKELEDWFDMEIKGNFDLDVFGVTFDEQKKYSILLKDQNALLLLRMEDLNEVFPEAIKAFLDLENPLDLKNENVGDTKHYAKSYRTIKNKFKLDHASAHKVVQSKFFQHFYHEYQEEVMNKWAKNN